jgi:hypothetical protein
MFARNLRAGPEKILGHPTGRTYALLEFDGVRRRDRWGRAVGTIPAQFKKAARPDSDFVRKRMDSLAMERAKRIEAIQLARDDAPTSDKLIEQAYQLLTGRFWSRADCSQRSDLLKVADWLLQLHGRNQACFGASTDALHDPIPRRNP